MRLRQILLTSLTLGISGLAIGIGSVASGTALAGAEPSAARTATVVKMRGDGQAISCTFTDLVRAARPFLADVFAENDARAERGVGPAGVATPNAGS
jgi:hypothetical protein